MRVADNRKSRSFKSLIFSWEYMVMTILTLLPCFYFGMQLSSIPMPEAWWPLGVVAEAMASPLSGIYGLIQGFLPDSVKVFFPSISVQKLMVLLGNKPGSAQSGANQGEIHWFVIACVPFWQLFWVITCEIIAMARKNLTLTNMQEALQQAIPQQHKLHALSHYKAAPEAAVEKPSPSSDKQKIMARLVESKATLAAPPVKVNRPLKSDWQQYKTKEGDLLLQDMVRQLRQENQSLQAQKTELKTTFSQYFSPDVIEYLEQNKNSFQSVHNKTQTISILFCDLRGFSLYSQQASSEALVAYLEEYFEMASHYILHRHNGVISKLMGDGLMAYWGFPVDSQDHAYTATLAAQGILQEVAMRNTLYPNRHPLKVGMGIATGEVIIGNIGSSDFKDFTLIGNPVNLASRLQEVTKTLNTDLLICEQTYQAIRDRVSCRAWGEKEIRGWSRKENVYTPEL